MVQIAKDSKQSVSGLHFQVKNTECNVFAIGEFTIGNLPTVKVKEIMKQLLSEHIIYRGVVDGNDEFVWVMNLSGEFTDTSAKYKIRGYDKNYADFLKNDKNFNIVARMMILMEERKRFCQEEAGRRFKKYWNPITIKIAIA